MLCTKADIQVSTQCGKYIPNIFKSLCSMSSRNLAMNEVSSVSSAIHESFETREQAVSAFERARGAGCVAVI